MPKQVHNRTLTVGCSIFFLSRTNLENLDLSHKTDLDYLDCFEGGKTHRFAELIALIYLFVECFEGGVLKF